MLGPRDGVLYDRFGSIRLLERVKKRLQKVDEYPFVSFAKRQGNERLFLFFPLFLYSCFRQIKNHLLE
jgi:hypothetical protein